MDLKIKHEPLEYSWTDSNTIILDNNGKFAEAGTCLLINNQIIFLSPLTVEQLTKLKTTVNLAIDHELKKR